MLTSNIWVEMGLVNGAMGVVEAIYYTNGAPPDLPVAVMICFDMYSGPCLPDGTVPIAPIRRTWFSAGAQCSRLQLPLKLAWGVTIHKAQGLTLNKVVIDVGKKEFCAGLTFVACSRFRHVSDLLFNPPFPYQCLANLNKSHRLKERQLEDARLQVLQDEALSSTPPMNDDSVLIFSQRLESSLTSLPQWELMSAPTPSPPEWGLISSPTPSPPEWDLMSSPTPSPEWDLMSSPTPSPPEWDLMSSPSPFPQTPEWDFDLMSSTPSPSSPDWDLIL